MDKSGAMIKGELAAPSNDVALEKLKEMGYVPVNLTEWAEVPKKLSLGEKKVTLTELALFSRQLSTMLSTGIPVTRALSTLAKQCTNPTLANALNTITGDVEGGSTLTDAFAKFPKIFNSLYLSMVRAGEAGGLLETTLLRMSNQLHKDKKLKDDIKSATTYPKVVGCFAIVIFIGMLVLLVPTFEGMAGDPASVPAISQFIFNVSHSLRERWYLWIIVIIALIIGIMAFAKSRVGHNLWENVKLRLPIFGSIITKSVIARFARTLATLIDGGIPIVKALQTAGPTAGSDLVERAVAEAIVSIEEGASISSSLEKSGLFPPMVTQMISIGEEAGTLPVLLDKIAEFYEEDVETESKALGSALEPVVLVGVGLLVGGMLIALYLPMFNAVINTDSL